MMARMKQTALARSLVGMGILAALSFPSPAHADEADDLIAESIEFRKDNRDHEALPLLVKALEKHPSARVFAHLGTCEQALGLWVPAETHINQALARTTDPWIQKNEGELRKALEFVQAKIGSIEIWGGPEGARISIDDEEVGTLPLRASIRATIGSRMLSVTAPGFFPEKRPIEVRAGKLANREHVALRPMAQQAEKHPHAEQSLAATTLATTNGGPSASASTSPERPLYQKWWFWTVIGAVAAGGGAAIYFLSRSNQSCSASMGGTCTNF